LILPKNIMVVEDDLFTQKYLKRVLIELDIQEVDCFSNANIVLEQIKFKTYDLILMDIALSGSMDGIQLSKQILLVTTVPIIFISAYGDDETFEESLEISPYGFLQKPFGMQDLKKTLFLGYKRYLSEHSRGETKVYSEYITINSEYTYSNKNRHLYQNKTRVKLNAREQKFIDILVKNVDSVVNYNELVYNIWDNYPIAESSLRTLVYTIRKKFPTLPIVSYSKVGYSLNIE